jgi:hypothetical protein
MATVTVTVVVISVAAAGHRLQGHRVTRKELYAGIVALLTYSWHRSCNY